MRIKKIFAGMTAAAMLANFGTGAFAESEWSVSINYTQPMLLSGVSDGYLVSLETGATYEINLANVCGDEELGMFACVSVSVGGTGTATVYLDYDFAVEDNIEMKSVKLGTVNTESVDLDLTDKGINWSGSNYRLRFVNEGIENAITISAVEFKNAEYDTVVSFDASVLAGIAWKGNALSATVSLDEWNHFFYTNKDIRLSDFDVIPGEWIKVTCHATDEANGDGCISVNGYDDGFDYTSVPASGEVYVLVTEAMANNGIAFRGANLTIDSVQFQSAKTPDKRTTEKALFEGSAELNSTEGYESPNVKCGRVDAQPGDIIRVEFAELGENGGWFDLRERGWNRICGNGCSVYGGLTEMEFTLNADDAQAIRENGLLINGDNITIKKVVLCSGAERADIKDALAKVEYYGENSRDEYWLNLARYNINPDVYNSAAINISGSGDLEAFYNTYDENGEHRYQLALTNGEDGSTLTVQNFPNNFCIAAVSGKVYIESIVLSDGKNEIVIESDHFDGYEPYAALTAPDYSLDWNKIAYITAKDIKATGAKAGDLLKITADSVRITPDQGDPYDSCCVTVYPFCSEEPDADGIDGYTYWTLTQEMIDKGISLRGECNITNISLCAKSGETRNPVDETVQAVFVNEPVQFVVEREGEDDQGNHYEDFTSLAFGACSIFHAGDVLRLNCSIDDKEENLLMVTTSDYKALNTDLTDEYGNIFADSGIGWYDIVLTAEDVAKIEKIGLMLWGKGVTVNSAVLISDTEIGETPLVAEVTGKEYIINDPLSFLPVNAQVAYVVADVYGNYGWGDISYNSPTKGWIQGHEDGSKVGIDEWRFDFTAEAPLESGSQIFIQKYDNEPIYIHEVRFYDSSDIVIFTLDADNAALNVVPFTTLNDGEEFWLNPGYFLGEELYAQFDKMVIETKGGNFITAGYVASNGEYTESTADSTTLELNKSDLGEDWVKLVAASGAVDLISVTYYDAEDNVLKVLDYTNVNENNIPATPFTTLAKNESYVISPYALLNAEQIAALDTITVETTGDSSCGGALSWMQLNPDKTDDDGNPIYDFKRTEDSNAGDEWRLEHFGTLIDEVQPNLTVNCWWDEVEEEGVMGECRVGIAAVRFLDAEGNELYRIDIDNPLKTLGEVEHPVSDEDYSHNYPVNITGILEKIGSELTAEDVGRVEVRTLGNGGLNVGRKEMVNEELKWINSGWINAGGVVSVDVNLSNEDGSVTIQNWDHENVFELYSVSLYDKDGTLIVTLNASNAYLNSDLSPILNGETVIDEENHENDKYVHMNIYPKSILGNDFSKLATVEIESYGDGASSFRSVSGGSNEDRHINCSGWDSFDVALKDDSSVLELWADNGRLIVMTVVFRDAQGNVLAELTGEDFWQQNQYSGVNENLLAELTSDNGTFVVNGKQLLGEKLADLSYISVKAKGYGNFGIGWNADYNQWVQTGFDLYADTDGSYTTATLTAEQLPGETHSEILIMNWDGYQAIESVTFYDNNDNVLFELNSNNAKLNTETLDCTEYVKFNMYDYPLYIKPDFMDDQDYNGNVWFAPAISVSEGTQFNITVVVKPGNPEIDSCELTIKSGDTVIAKWSDLEITEEEHIVTLERVFSAEEAALINDTGLSLEGYFLEVRSIVLGSAKAPENLTAIPGSNRATLTWDAVPYADKYSVYMYDTENSSFTFVGETTQPTYEVSELTNGQEYRFAVKVTKKEFTGTVTYEDSVTVTPSDFAVTAHSLLLGSDIGVNFYMSIADSIMSEPGARIDFTIGNETICAPLSSAVSTDNGYRLTVTVAAAEMNDVITGQLYINDEAYGSEFSYSVKDYADYILENSASYEKEVPLVNAMLNYGAAAEKYFRQSTEMSFTKPDVSARELAQYKYTMTDDDAVIDFKGQIISLESKVAAKLCFTGKEFVIGDFTVTENGSAVEASRLSLTSDGKDTYLEISGISADEMDNVFEVSVGSVTISNYSVYSYIHDALRSTDEELYDVVAALYEYGCAADTYTAS